MKEAKIKAAKEAYNDMRFWEYIKENLADENHRYIANMFFESCREDMLANAELFLADIEAKAYKEAEKQKHKTGSRRKK